MDEKELIRGEVKGYLELAKLYHQTFTRRIAEKDFRVAVDVGHAKITREDAEEIERLATTLIEVLEREKELQ